MSEKEKVSFVEEIENLEESINMLYKSANVNMQNFVRADK
jgi:hypothetical protein